MANLQVLSAPQNQPTLNPKVVTNPVQPSLNSRVVTQPQQPTLAPQVVTQPTQPQLNPQVQSQPSNQPQINVDNSPRFIRLGELVKTKYPGIYDSVESGALGKIVATKYPGVYDSLIESVTESKKEKELRPGLTGIVERFLKGGASTIVDTAKLAGNSLIHPVKTLESFGDPLVGLIGKLVPGASTEKQNEIANAVGQYFKDRYGSLDAVKQTAYEDPFGFALDVATLFDAGAGILSKAGKVSKLSSVTKASEVVSKAGEIVNPITSTARAVSKVTKPIRETVAPRLEASATKQYSQALSATTKTNKLKSEKVVPQLLERKVTAFTKEGLQSKFAGEVEKAGVKLEEAYAKLPEGARTNIRPIFDSLQEKKMKSVANGVVIDDATYKAYESIQRKLLEVANESVSVHSMRTLRQIWDKATKRTGKSFGLSDTDSAVAEARKAGANAIRNELAEQFPEVGKVNAEFSFWKNSEDVIKATIERTRSQVGLLEPGAQIIGLATGSTVINSILKGLALKNAIKLFRSTGWRTISATQKHRLAKFLMEGKSAEASKMIQEMLRAGSLASRGND